MTTRPLGGLFQRPRSFSDGKWLSLELATFTLCNWIPDAEKTVTREERRDRARRVGDDQDGGTPTPPAPDGGPLRRSRTWRPGWTRRRRATVSTATTTGDGRTGTAYRRRMDGDLARRRKTGSDDDVGRKEDGCTYA
jgi:hypothetical protein